MNNISQVNIQYMPSPEELDKSRDLKAGKFMWPGFTHEYSVFAKQLAGGKWRYQTGLVPAEVSEERRAEVEQAVEELENYYGKGQLDPFNHSFWKDVKLVINKKNIFLDIKNNPEHKLLYYVIKGNGINEVAPSYDNIVEASYQKRWFMVEPEEFADIEAETDKVLNKAIAGLVYLEEEKTLEDMFLIHKNLITSDRGTTRQTPKSALYKDLSDFIYGKIVKTDKRKTPKQFTDAVKLIKSDKKLLYVTAYVREAIYFNFLLTSDDGNLQNVETKTKYGTTPAKAIQFLANPVNADELNNIKERVEKKWTE